MRFFFNYSDAEWRYIEAEAKRLGFKTVCNFINHRIRKSVVAIPPDTLITSTLRVSQSFLLTNPEIEAIIKQYSAVNHMSQTMFIRRIATEPVVQQYLLAEADQ